MTKYLDKGKVEKAFKRAARTAVSGSRDARSGRFMPPKEKATAGANGLRPRKKNHARLVHAAAGWTATEALK